MATDNSAAFVLPKVPVPHKDFISYLQGRQDEPVQHIIAPYNEYEAKLREGFAQHRDHQALEDPKVMRSLSSSEITSSFVSALGESMVKLSMRSTSCHCSLRIGS